MLLIVLPGQLIGSFVAFTMLPLSVLGDRPELGVLLGVLPGLVAGIGIGLLLRPDRDQILGYALVGAAVAVASLLLLSGLGRLRGPESIPEVPLVYQLRELLIAAVVPTVAAVPLWLLRRRRSGVRTA